MASAVRSIGIVVGILALAGVQSASAQITEPMEFTTSFPFTVGYATVPAGSYTVRQDADNPAIFELTGSGTTVLFQTMDAQMSGTPSKTEVVFRRYGSDYVLKDIWLDGADFGAEAIAVEGERHTAKQRRPEGEERVPARRKSDASKDR
jgi:hypothetical protein